MIVLTKEQEDLLRQSHKERIPIRTIAEMINISKSTVGRRVKKIDDEMVNDREDDEDISEEFEQDNPMSNLSTSSNNDIQWFKIFVGIAICIGVVVLLWFAFRKKIN